MKYLKLLFIIAYCAQILQAQNGFQVLDIEIPNELGQVTSFVHPDNHEYWIGGTNGLLHVENENHTFYTTDNSNLNSSHIICLWWGSNILYIGTEQGLNYYVNSTFYSIHNQNGLSNSPVRSIFESDGKIYTGTSDGLGVFFEEQWLFYELNKPVYVIEKFQNNIYIGSTDGLYKINGDSLENITNTGRVRAIKAFNKNLWLSDDIQGTFTYNGTQVQFHNSFGKELDYFSIHNDVLWGSNNQKLMEFENDQTWIYYKNGIKALPSQHHTQNIILTNNNDILKFNKEEYVMQNGRYSPQNTKNLDINNINTSFSNQNLLHFDVVNNTSGFEVPKNTKNTTISYSDIILIGIDENDDKHITATSGNIFQPGPVKLSEPVTDSTIRQNFNRIWTLDKKIIDEFRHHYETGEIQNGKYPVDYEIESWPGNGPEGYTSQLAPYVDRNGDGVYNPMDGDYPELKGDKMFYWIMNDVDNTNNPSLGLGLEFHCKAWAYSYPKPPNDSVDVINNTTFLEVDIVNRSQINYHDVFFALYSYFDLGNEMDNYIGCDVMGHSYYCYNGDDFDEGFYQDKPPAQSITFLNSPVRNYSIDSSEYCNLSRFVDWYMPISYYEPLYDLFNGFWPSGDQIIYGYSGFGYDGIPAAYIYPGDSDPHLIGTNGIQPPGYEDRLWTEYEEDNPPFKRDGYGINGPFDLDAGETVSYTFAFIFAQDSCNYPCSLDKLRRSIRIVNNWYKQDTFPTNYQSISDEYPYDENLMTENKNDFNIYPNPANDYVTIEFSSQTNSPEESNYVICDIQGRPVVAGKIQTKKKIIHLRNLPSGTYLVEIEQNNNRSRKQIIITKQ